MSSFGGVKGFKLNQAGVRDQILKSYAVSNECLRYAERIAANANYLAEADGAEYVAEIRTQGRTRAGAIVRPNTDEATRDNLKNNTLEKALRS